MDDQYTELLEKARVMLRATRDYHDEHNKAFGDGSADIVMAASGDPVDTLVVVARGDTVGDLMEEYERIVLDHAEAYTTMLNAPSNPASAIDKD